MQRYRHKASTLIIVANGDAVNYSVILLISVITAQHHGQSSQDNFQIEQERPVLYVEEIKFDHLIKRQTVATRDLPQSSQSRLHIEPLAMPELIGFDLIRNRRARAHDAHVAA